MDFNHIYKVLSWHNFVRDKEGEGKNVGVFASLPENLAKQYPLEGRKKGDDTSPAHVTILYIGDLKSPEEKIIKIVKNVCSNLKPFRCSLGQIDQFVNKEDGQRVLHSKIESENDKLQTLHYLLKLFFTLAKIPYSDKWPKFQPHSTIDYADLDKKSKYENLKPSGEWTLNNVWIWGLKKPCLVKLG